MGRPSLASVRCEELLDAAVVCILERGVEGTTIARIAAIAGVPSSLVHHYLGNRAEIMEAAVQRATANVERAISESLVAEAPGDRFRHHLDVLFGESFATPQVNQLVDELIAASYRSPALRDSVRRMYEHFLVETRSGLRAAFPSASDLALQRAAYGIVALAHSVPSLESVGVDPDGRRFARQLAERFVFELAESEETE